MIDESLDDDFEMEPTDLDPCSVTIGPFTVSRIAPDRILVKLKLGYTDSCIGMLLSPEDAELLSRLLADPEELPICCCCDP
jgi:hypothetical protein